MKNKLTDDYQFILNDQKLATYLNPYQYLRLRDKNILPKFHNFYFDGFLLCRLSNLFFGLKLRVMPPDLSGFLGKAFQDLVSNKETLAVIGGNEEENKKACDEIEKEFKGVALVYRRNGYFQSKTETDTLIQYLGEINPGLILIGMGAEYQETLALRIREKIKGSIKIVLCGGFISQTAKGVDYYPKLIQDLGLRWFYRIIDEPKLIVRYAFKYPLGIFYFLYDSILEKKT